MDFRDHITFGMGALKGHRLRSVLSAVGIGIGVASVVLLTSIGEGTRRYILSQFTQFGTTIIAVNPGKTQTLGIPGVFGGTTRKLTIDDAESLRRVPNVTGVVPLTFGTANVEGNGLSRRVFVYGVTPEIAQVWRFNVGVGSFWPSGDPRRGLPLTVLGPKLKRELFGEQNALGQFVRIGGVRFRVVGLMEPKGRMLGFDIDDSCYVPVMSAMRMFNQDELLEIDILYASADYTDAVEEGVRQTLMERHAGKEDFTVTTQAAMLETFGNVMGVITMSVGVIAGISLFVGAIGIFTVMWIAVGERVPEIGLLRSIGATAGQVAGVFMLEALALAATGGLAGLLLALGGISLLKTFVPGLPVEPAPLYVVAALAASAAAGLASGVLPARRAAALDPIEALRAE